MRVSSTYWMIGKSDEELRGIGRFKIPLFLALFKMDWRRSAARTKRWDERGSPCLTPLLQCTVFPGIPLRRTLQVLEERIVLIQDSQVMPKPLASSNLKMELSSILSKAFSKSSFSMIRYLLDLWHTWRYSSAQAKQSWMVLVFMKPYWFWWMRLLIGYCNLFAISLVNNFTEELSKEIDL